eukprot:8637132-Pyramimonas_sp.AAC.2
MALSPLDAAQAHEERERSDHRLPEAVHRVLLSHSQERRPPAPHGPPPAPAGATPVTTATASPRHRYVVAKSSTLWGASGRVVALRARRRPAPPPSVDPKSVNTGRLGPAGERGTPRRRCRFRSGERT